MDTGKKFLKTKKEEIKFQKKQLLNQLFDAKIEEYATLNNDEILKLSQKIASDFNKK